MGPNDQTAQPDSSDAGRSARASTAEQHPGWHSLRSRLTLALLVTGLASAVVVGLVARSLVHARFDRLLLDSSFTRVEADVIAYVGKFGSWQAAAAVQQPFSAFADSVNAQRAQPASGLAAGAEPPFGFVFLDPASGRVLFGSDEYAEGQPVADSLRARARPIRVGGHVAVLAVPLRNQKFSVYDASYLAAMEDAMLYGVVTAALLALVLGFYFGAQLSRDVRALTDAIGAMSRGELRQRVAVRSRDEVGLLASVFNRMSAELSESHAQVAEQAAQLKELSIHDELTGLHNRRHFVAEAAHAYARARRYRHPLAVMICDVDHFKGVNDRFSHAIGDAVLARLGRLLQAATRESDIVARYGGEEFVVVFPQTTVDQAAGLCERIRRQVASHDWGAIQPGVGLTLSMGLDGDLARGSIEVMLAAADGRMYAAKAAGRNRIVADGP